MNFASVVLASIVFAPTLRLSRLLSLPFCGAWPG
jgi:hypothetical protein